jgi:outer membrane protein
MLKTRLLLVAVCAVVIFVLFQLPKSVVENEGRISGRSADDSVASHIQNVAEVPAASRERIVRLKAKLAAGTENEKNAIFADSLADLYRLSNRFDSAGWFAEESWRYSKSEERRIKAGDDYYQAFSIELDQAKQRQFAAKAQEIYAAVLKDNPANLEVKTRMAMTYVVTETPMQGIKMLREVLASDPDNQAALFNMGMLSIQSGQFDLAVQRLQRLVNINPGHIQGQLLLGLALKNSGDPVKARAQFEKVKAMDDDPAVQATADSYLKDLK